VGNGAAVSSSDPHGLLLPIEVVPLSDDVTSVFVHGELDLAEAGELRAVLNDACAGPHRTVIVDLSGVGFMGSSAMGVLAQASSQLARDGRKLQLRGCQRQVLRAFEVTGLDQALDIS
jgi:anti-sigma B factor antagonist